MKSIKNFIYLDKDRLNSLYSQTFEGVAEAIVNSYVNSMDSSNKENKPLLGETLEEKVGELSTKTENKILYDHMYNQLESKLDSVIFRPEEVNNQNYESIFENKFIIKVTGKAQIHNYNRMKLYFERFNDIGRIIAYSQAQSDPTIIKKIAEINNNTNLKKSQKEEHKNREIEAVAKKFNLMQDQKLLDNLKEMTELYNNDGLEIIVSQEKDKNIIYRAILDEKYLRISTELLRVLYTLKPSESWSIVGQITYIPKKQEEITTDNNNDDENKEISFRDSYKKMFDASLGLENFFFDGTDNIEICIAPIAIYTEQKIEIE